MKRFFLFTVRLLTIYIITFLIMYIHLAIIVSEWDPAIWSSNRKYCFVAISFILLVISFFLAVFTPED